jgi:hypothetical protein
MKFLANQSTRGVIGFSLMILILVFAVPHDLEAAKKPPFRFTKPDVDAWISYCKRHHPDESLKKCCDRREKVCDKRCYDSSFPSGGYDTLDNCLRDCGGTNNKCQERAISSHGSGFQAPPSGKVQQTPPPSPFKSQFNIQQFMQRFSLRSRGIETLPPLVIPDPEPPALPNFELEKKTP